MSGNATLGTKNEAAGFLAASSCRNYDFRSRPRIGGMLIPTKILPVRCLVKLVGMASELELQREHLIRIEVLCGAIAVIQDHVDAAQVVGNTAAHCGSEDFIVLVLRYG